MLAYLVEWSNAMVQEQTAEIFDYHVHGEYGAEESPEVAALSATFGSGFHFGGKPTSSLLGGVSMPSAAISQSLRAAFAPSAVPAAATAGAGGGGGGTSAPANVPLAFAAQQPAYFAPAPAPAPAQFPLLPPQAYMPQMLAAAPPPPPRPRIVHIVRGNR